MSVAILKQGGYLIASIRSDLSDSEVIELRNELAELVGKHRSRGIVIDVAALDVIDSFVTRALEAIVLTAKLRGAQTVIVGIHPDVAIAMVHFRLNLRPLRVALDLEAATGLLDRLTQGERTGMEDEVRVAINADADLVTARAEGRAMAQRLGFPRPDPTLIATAISEIARNIVVHVGRGEIVLKPFEDAHRYGLVVIAKDDGPGIRDVEAALRDDYSGRGGLGLGLPGARRLMDEFEIASDADSGTTVTMTKWRFRDELARLREERRRRA